MGYVDGKFRPDDYDEPRRERRPALTDKRADALMLAAGYIECQCEELRDGIDEHKEGLYFAAEYMRDLARWHFRVAKKKREVAKMRRETNER